MNGGACILGQGNYHCECDGWDGPHCETRKYHRFCHIVSAVFSLCCVGKYSLLVPVISHFKPKNPCGGGAGLAMCYPYSPPHYSK